MKRNIAKNLAKTIVSVIALFYGNLTAFAQNWAPLVQDMQYYPPNVLYADTVDNYLYMAGSFTSINGVSIKGIARWNGLAWDSVGNASINDGSPIYAIARYGTDLYVGGAFDHIGPIQARGLGKWNGVSWDSLPGILQNRFGALDVIDNLLYAGGNFDSLAGQPCQSFAIWNGSSWNPVGLPPEIRYDWDPSVFSTCKYNGEIYVGGNFASYLPLATDTIMDIIRWDGVNWKSVGGGMRGGTTCIAKMVVFQGELYVAGLFYKSQGNIGNSIQKWNGSQWTEVGGGITPFGSINEMFVYNNKLYVAGNFVTAGGIPADGIAIWDGINWCGLGSTFDNVLTSATFYNDTLIVGGGFWTIDGDSILRIAKWLGGNFVDQCGNDIGLAEDENFDFINLYPNPSESYVIISIDNWELFNSGNYVIYNLLGEQIKSGFLNSNQTTIEISEFCSGIYSIEIIIDNKRVSKKLIKI